LVYEKRHFVCGEKKNVRLVWDAWQIKFVSRTSASLRQIKTVKPKNLPAVRRWLAVKLTLAAACDILLAWQNLHWDAVSAR
jgi:hypothetical protein